MPEPQTAQQINMPQTGSVTFSPKPAADVPSVKRPQVQKREQPAVKKPEGWWQICDFQGTLPGLIAVIDGNADIPAHWKEAMKADAQAAATKGCNFFYLDAHYHADKNQTLHYTLQPTKASL